MLNMKRLLVYLLASVAIVAGAKAQDMKSTPLTFEATEDGTTITITNPLGLTIEYSTDGGTSWTSSSANPITVSSISAEQTVQLRGNNAAYSNGTIAGSTIINFDKDCYAYGNVMSLVSSTGFATATELTANNTFYDLFDSNTYLKIYATKELLLPATTLTDGCYSNMFYKCTSLAKAPALPATTLAAACYKSMFSSCSGLTEACELPATTLVTECYARMFMNCKALSLAPELPATTLADYCYSYMFYGCNTMTTAPELPALTMVNNCYEYMFGFCHGLTATPALPATTLAENCYYRMFLGCNGLTTITSLPATTMAPYCYNEMFRQCGALTSGPTLPATTLADYCYRCMFQACTALTTPSELPATALAKGCYLGMYVNTALTATPALPATTLAESCYYQMFQNNPKLESSPTLPASTLAKTCYYKMFADCPLLATAGDISATTAGENCCEYMFMNCIGLETAPVLAATTLAPACYNYMFSGCTKLTTAPVLPATTLAEQCYQRMFEECHALVTAPALPATNLAYLCYNDMFWNCTSLKNAPVLPATKLADYCYTMMFLGCSSLETAPDLPAAKLTPGCYEHMFVNCNSLNYVKCLATDLGDATSTEGWLTKVAATGTFVQAAGQDWSAKGTTVDKDFDDPSLPCTFIHGIPTGWTAEVNPTADVQLNSDGAGNYWATYYCSAGNTADASTTVYTAKLSSDQTKVELTEVPGRVIPADNAVVLKSSAEFATMTYTPAATGTLADNDLLGTAAAITTPENTYMLVGGASGVGFYHWTGSEIPAGRGYLIIAGGGSVKAFYPLGGDEGTTAIEMAETADEAQDAVLYDLSGRRVQGRPAPGIYVKNGKKYIIR